MKQLTNDQKAQLPHFILGTTILIAGFILISEDLPIWGLTICGIAIFTMFYPFIKENKKTIKLWLKGVPLIVGILFFAFGILDQYTTRIADMEIFQAFRDSAGNNCIYAGAFLFGLALMYLWFVNENA